MQRLAFFSLLITVINAVLLVAAPAVAAETPAGAADAPAGTPSSIIVAPAAGGLTADDVARRAAATSHEVRARSEETAAADATVTQSKTAFIPRLSGVARYTRLSAIEEQTLGSLVAAPGSPPGPLAAGAPLAAVPLSFPVILDQYTAQATLQIPLSDYLLRFPRLVAASRGNARAAALLQQASRLQVATDARVAYYSWARARMQRDVAERSLAQARAHLKDVSAAHQSGAASKADVLRVESQVAGNELAVTRAHAATQMLEQRLRTLMHDDSGKGYEIGEDLRATPAPEAASALLAKPAGAMVAEALEQRLEPRALVHNAEALRAQASAQRAAGLPRIDLVGNLISGRPNPRIFPQKDEFARTWDASVQLSFSPTDLFGTEAGRSATLARSRQLEAERAGLADAIELEVAQARHSLTEAEAAIRSAERGLAAAEESYRVRRALFQNGRATSVELTDAETERSRAQLEIIATRIDRRVAEVRLLHATGRDVTRGN